MERETNSMQSLCRAGCGFYGSPATNGLCSVCFKEALKKKQQQPINAPSGAFTPHSLTSVDNRESSKPNDSEASQDASISHEEPKKTENNKDPKKKTRCFTCQRKVGFSGVECRCGGIYCGLHRYSDKHNCTFDYRSLGAEEIRKSNPVVAGEKIKKI